MIERKIFASAQYASEKKHIFLYRMNKNVVYKKHAVVETINYKIIDLLIK